MKHSNDAADPTSDDGVREQLTTAEVLGWSELACWIALVLTPILCYVNGPSVSTDQAVVRAALFILSLTGAALLRCVNWRRSTRGQRGDRP